jgi:hypothetical protein
MHHDTPSVDSTLSFDVLVAGAGIGGVSAALDAARSGRRVALLEAAPEIGGTGVHSPVGLVCTWFDKSGRYINRGLYEEMLPYLFDPVALQKRVIQTYHEKELKATYLRLLAAEPTLSVFTSCPVATVEKEGRRILAVRAADGRRFAAKVFVDSTADGNLSALAGASFQKGRESDGKMQPSTLTFRVDGVDFRALGFDPTQAYWATWDRFEELLKSLMPPFLALRAAGGTSSPKEDVLCFPDRDGQSLLFNQTRIADVDPTDPASVAAALREGRKQAEEFWGAIRTHPAFAKATLTLFDKLGVREGRRILGDYLLTGEDCLGEARFDDMVAACGYAVDIHDPDGTAKTHMVWIPGSGYYHIPYRCLYSKDFDNLLLGSRCISGTHEAHSSYRVMPPISSIGQAAGTAAALFAERGCHDVREIKASWIRQRLSAAGQFIEGTVE